jgi:hypothetical protein
MRCWVMGRHGGPDLGRAEGRGHLQDRGHLQEVELRAGPQLHTAENFNAMRVINGYGSSDSPALNPSHGLPTSTAA